MAKKYHSLLVRELTAEGRATRWGIEFGDYDNAVVRQELADMKDGGFSGFANRVQTKIITTNDDQDSINAAVAALNS